jgi:PAS domain S-box-containing protein
LTLQPEISGLRSHSANCETLRRKKDGSLIYVNVSMRTVWDAEGRVEYFVRNVKDVTYLKVQRDTKMVEARYRDLLESTPDAIVIINATERIVLINSRTEVVFGYSRSELLGQPIEVLLPPRYRVGHVGHLSNYFTQPRTRSMDAGPELYGLRKSGEEFPVEISLGPLQTEEGVLAMSAIRDITDHRRIQETLRKQAQILDLASDTIFIRDLEGRITYWNHGAERLYGWTREEVLGKSKHPLLLTVFPRPLEEINQHLAESGHWEGELIHTRRDGSQVSVESRWTLHRDKNNEPSAVLEINHDITERKRFEESLRKANQMKSEFMANMSHELRTPLNGILGFTEFLVDEKPGPLNPKQKEYLTDVHNSAQHLLQLINDVLDLAKVEAGKIELHPETFSPAKAIEEVCAVIKGIAQKKKVKVTWNVSSDLDSVTLDQQKFKQICYNLLANAVKFTDSGGSVEIHALARDRERFDLRVSDTGIGIKNEDMQRLFREFEQLETGTARRFEGTGLGLALTKKLVELQGGSIAVESEFGNGTTFSVTMPRALLEVPSNG